MESMDVSYTAWNWRSTIEDYIVDELPQNRSMDIRQHGMKEWNHRIERWILNPIEAIYHDRMVIKHCEINGYL